MPLTSLPRPQQPITEEGQHIERTWYMALIQLISNVSDAVIGPASSLNNQIVLFSGLTGKILKGATGSGFVTSTLGVYGTSNASAASKLLGRGSAGGAGIWEEISLGTGVTMSGTTLSASGVAYAPMSTGAEPLEIMSNGAGQVLMVGFEP